MKKRLKFQCWNCEKTYSLFREITGQQKLIVACPFCGEEAVAQLGPYRREVKNVLKTVDARASESTLPETELALPEIIPTEKPE